jgi:hypothetical protein
LCLSSTPPPSPPGSANGNDGPKWTCGIHLFKQPCIIFSLGCNNLIDFESEMYKWGQCTIHVFDPTVDGSIAPSLKQQAGATLHLLGLGAPGQVRCHPHSQLTFRRWFVTRTDC